MDKKISLLLLVGLLLLSLMVTSGLAAEAKAGKIEPKTVCWWVYRGTYPPGELWCYYCCNHPDLPPGCHDLFCELR